MLGVYFTYKIFAIDYYAISLDVENSSFDIKKEIKINSAIYEGDYIDGPNIKIPNYFSDFNKTESETGIVFTKTDDEKTIKFGISKEQIASPVKQFEDFVVMDKYIGKKVLQKNNINNDIELLKYIDNYKFSNRTIFTSIDKMLNDEAIYDFVVYYYFDDITIFDGYVSGYYSNIFNNECKMLYIFNGDNSNVITLCGDSYFTDDYIVDLLSKIKITNG
ncbi:MAG: hypothetical protein ACI31R_03010 [Bacilli bacterium]